MDVERVLFAKQVRFGAQLCFQSHVGGLDLLLDLQTDNNPFTSRFWALQCLSLTESSSAHPAVSRYATYRDRVYAGTNQLSGVNIAEAVSFLVTFSYLFSSDHW